MNTILLFDGGCAVCNASARFVLKHDPQKKVILFPLQSAEGKRRIKEYHLPHDLSTLVLIKEGKAYLRSSAFVQLVCLLSFPWPLLATLWIVPKPVRDFLYDVLAKNRHQWFGKEKVCAMK